MSAISNIRYKGVCYNEDLLLWALVDLVCQIGRVLEEASDYNVVTPLGRKRK